MGTVLSAHEFGSMVVNAEETLYIMNEEFLAGI